MQSIRFFFTAPTLKSPVPSASSSVLSSINRAQYTPLSFHRVVLFLLSFCSSPKRVEFLILFFLLFPRCRKINYECYTSYIVSPEVPEVTRMGKA